MYKRQVYGCLARYLGLGAQGGGEGNWDELVEDLGLMVLAFLFMEPKQITRSARASR